MTRQKWFIKNDFRSKYVQIRKKCISNHPQCQLSGSFCFCHFQYQHRVHFILFFPTTLSFHNWMSTLSHLMVIYHCLSVLNNIEACALQCLERMCLICLTLNCNVLYIVHLYLNPHSAVFINFELWNLSNFYKVLT